jgi:hypothetical protein
VTPSVIFPTPLFLPAPPERSVLVSAARSAAINQDFAQNRFALRSVIATIQNFLKIWKRLIARSAPQRRGERANKLTAKLTMFRLVEIFKMIQLLFL